MGKNLLQYPDLGERYYLQKGIFTFAFNSTGDSIPSTFLEAKVCSLIVTSVVGSIFLNERLKGLHTLVLGALEMKQNLFNQFWKKAWASYNFNRYVLMIGRILLYNASKITNMRETENWMHIFTSAPNVKRSLM